MAIDKDGQHHMNDALGYLVYRAFLNALYERAGRGTGIRLY